MTDFQNALAQFLKGQLDVQALESSLDIALQQDPGSAQQILGFLDQLFRASRLPAKLYISLKQQIDAAAAQPAPAAPAPTPVPASVPDRHSESTQGSSDILDIVQPAMEEPPAPEKPPASEEPQPLVPEPRPSTPAPTPPLSPEGSSDILDILQAENPDPAPGNEDSSSAVVGDESQPSEDKTVFRQSAPPKTPRGHPSVPHSGTGESVRTGATGAATGTSGSRSYRTGTGSSWTDPSKWGEGPAPTMQPGSILKDRYVLETVIGRGGMGVVFKAVDLRREEAQDRNPHIAIKILNDEFRRHPESLKALQRESRKAQDLAHPNIVTVFDFDRDGPTVYMTMEFLEGQSLDRITKDAAFDGMSLKEAYPLIEGLGRALGYAHDKGVVHSDFKPANTFLTKDGVIKVFDFGIARAAKLPGESSGDMTLFDPGSLGALTPAYASCEMIEGEEPDPRDDIYALACLAYELLTGKHPYDRRAATEARDKGRVLKPIKGLSRRNWRAIQKGLAFRREDRSPSVEEFLDELKIRKLNKVYLSLAAAASVTAIGIAVTVGPDYWDAYQTQRMVRSIVESDNANIRVVLQDLEKFDAEGREEVIRNGQVEDRLIEYFISEIERAESALDYPRAESILADALKFYDDSNRIATTGRELDRTKKDLLAELDDRYNVNLQAGRIMPSDGEDIVKVLNIYERIDPGHPALTDPQLAIAYGELARQFLAVDVQQASLVIDEGQKRFPDDAVLVGLRDRVNTLREVQNRELRVAELESELSALLGSIQSVQDFRAIEKDMLTLETLDSSSQVVSSLRQRLEALLNDEVSTALGENNWSLARTLLSDNSGLISTSYSNTVLERIERAEGSYNDRIGGVLASVNDAVQTGDLVRASASLAQLEQLGAAPATISEARGIVSRGYLDASRKQMAAGDFAQARALIESGQRVAPGNANWQAELISITNAEQLQAVGLAEQERQKLELQREAQITTLRDRIQANLGSSPFGIEIARRTLDSIDELARLDPGAELAVQGRREVAAKLATEARGIGIRDQKYAESLELVAAAIELLPAERSLRTAQTELQSEQQDFLARQAAAKEGELKAELEGLIESPTYDSDWESSLRRVIQSLEPVGTNAAFLQGKRDEIAELYVGRAKLLRSEERFDLAERMLASALWFVPQFAPAVEEGQLLTAAKREFDSANQERQSLAQIDGLKRTFTTELNAERLADAKVALGRLRDLLPSDDPFISTDAPKAIGDTYFRIASRVLNEGRFETAEQIAREGLREVSGHRPLSQLVSEIRPRRLASNSQRLLAIIDGGPINDAAGARKLFEMVKQDAGQEFAEIQSELKAAADRRLASSGRDHAATSAWLGQIIDGYAATALAGPPCTQNLAGFGSRGRRGQCYDYLPGSSNEGPRLVVIPAGNGVARPYAISRQEVSIGQWNAYCRLSGSCSPRSANNEKLPITNISVEEAKAYAGWLSAGTNYTYRLPTDIEWEHAATATGSASISPNCINRQAGLLGDELLEVNRGGQNAWGLMNYLGNAQEWVIGPSGGYEARGGAYNDNLGTCEIGFTRPHAGNAEKQTGFRLVRELGDEA